ncbi:MAG: protein kinase [Planctomycetes bacterium]|nr:protein kinase [Planctomycetota bacterium]
MSKTLSAMAQFLQPKQQLAGYEIVELVGKGGMGEVYRARQMSMDRDVALKVLSPRLAKQDPKFAASFVEEARAAGRLSNPNIINVHDVGSAMLPGASEQVHYFSMEFVDGETLKDVIKREQIVSPDLISLVMHSMSEALVYAEKVGIVHRDIKPDNIMLTSNKLVKLADLGLAMEMNANEVVGERDEQGRAKVMGTPMYMSPEQARAQPVDHRSDQYSLGATLYHMLTGEPPFKGNDAKALMRAHVFDPIPDPRVVRPDVPEAWRQLAMKMLGKTPDERFATAADLRSAVQGAANGITLQSLSKRVRTPMGGKRSTRRVPAWVTLAAGILVIGIAAIAFWPKAQSKPGDPADGGRDPEIAVTPDKPRIDDGAALRTAIAALPTDHVKALSELDKLGGDAAYSSPAAKQAIAKERQRRSEALSASQSEALKAQFAAIDKRIADNDLAGARDALSALAAANPDATHADAIKATGNRIDAAVAALTKSFIDRIDAAASTRDLDALGRQAKEAQLAPDGAKAVEARIAQRRSQLDKSASEQARALDRKAWDDLATALDDRRRQLKYGDMRSVVEAAKARMSVDESKQLADALMEISEIASVGEVQLKNYIARQKPSVEARLNDVPMKVQVIKFGLTEVSYIVSDNVSYSGAKSIERLKMVLPWRDLITPALAGQKADDAQQIKAVCLWMWRSPDAREAIDAIASQPLAKALKAIDVSLCGGLDVAGAVTRKADVISISYDFLGKDAGLMNDWRGDGLAMGDRGMAWKTGKASAKGKRIEAELPRVAWKAGLMPPFTARARIWLNPGTQLALIGVEASDRRVRIGFSNNRAHAHLGMVTTTGDGATFNSTEFATRGFLSPSDPVDVELTVDTEGKVGVAYNQNVQSAPPEFLQLPAGAPVTLVLQAYQYDGGTTTIDVGSIELSGKPPPRP